MTSLSSFGQNIDNVRYNAQERPKVEIYGLNENLLLQKWKNLAPPSGDPYQIIDKDFQDKTSFKAFGGVATGGGNFCENRFSEVSDDIRNWIMNDGPSVGDLKLPAGVTISQHNSDILRWITASHVICVMRTEKEPYPIKINGVPKACAWITNKKSAIIACDYFAVMGDKSHAPMTDNDFYGTVYHEYASLAGFEPPNGSKSNYVVSNQISAYLQDTVVRRLALKKQPSSKTPTILPTYMDLLRCKLKASTGPSYKIREFTIMRPDAAGGVDIPSLMKASAEYEFIFVGSYSGKPYLENTNDKAEFTFNFDGLWISYKATRRRDGKVALFSNVEGETTHYVCEGLLAPAR